MTLAFLGLEWCVGFLLVLVGGWVVCSRSVLRCVGWKSLQNEQIFREKMSGMLNSGVHQQKLIFPQRLCREPFFFGEILIYPWVAPSWEPNLAGSNGIAYFLIEKKSGMEWWKSFKRPVLETPPVSTIGSSFGKVAFFGVLLMNAHHYRSISQFKISSGYSLQRSGSSTKCCSAHGFQILELVHASKTQQKNRKVSEMGVSENRGTPKTAQKWSFFVGKPMVVGYHHFREPPNMFCVICFARMPVTWHHHFFLRKNHPGGGNSQAKTNWAMKKNLAGYFPSNPGCLIGDPKIRVYEIIPTSLVNYFIFEKYPT